jgi:hypothetical protein
MKICIVKHLTIAFDRLDVLVGCLGPPLVGEVHMEVTILGLKLFLKSQTINIYKRVCQTKNEPQQQEISYQERERGRERGKKRGGEREGERDRGGEGQRGRGTEGEGDRGAGMPVGGSAGRHI